MPIATVLAFLFASLMGLVIGYQLKAGKTAAQIIKAASGWILIVYAALLASTLISLRFMYQELYSTLEQTGWAPNDYLLKATVGLMTGVGYFVVTALIGSFITLRNRRFVVGLTGVYCTMCLILFVASQPKPGQTANVKTGAPLMKFHRQADGSIELFGIQYRYHPNYPGVPLNDLTDKIYQEYEAQQKAKAAGTPLTWWKFAPQPQYVSREKDINLWFEGIESNNLETRVHLAVGPRTGNEFTGSGFLYPDRKTYLTDDSGNLYPLTSDLAVYPEEMDEKRKTKYKAARPINPGEVYRFVLVFPPLPPTAKSITLRDGNPSEPLTAVFNPPADPKTKLEDSFRISRARWQNFQITPSLVISDSAVGGGEGQGLSLTVMNVGISDYATFVNVKVRGSGKKLFGARAGTTRLTDEGGNGYRLLSDLGEYTTDQDPPYRTMTGEGYEFLLVFGRISNRIRYFTLHHWQFPPILVDLKGESLQYSARPDLLSSAEGQHTGEDKQLTLRVANALNKPTSANIWSDIQGLDFAKLTSALVTGSYESGKWTLLLPSDGIWHEVKARTRIRGNMVIEVLNNPDLPYPETAKIQYSLDEERKDAVIRPGESSRIPTKKAYDVSLKGSRNETDPARPYLIRIIVK